MPRVLSAWVGARRASKPAGVLRVLALGGLAAVLIASAPARASATAVVSRAGAGSSGGTATTSARFTAYPQTVPTSPCTPAELSGIRTRDAEPDNALDRPMFEYGDTGAGWTGGDGGRSVLLPNGRILWLEDDVFLGKIVHDARSAYVMVRNALVVQHGRRFTTLYAGTKRDPKDFMRYGLPNSSYWYWNAGAIVIGHAVWISYSAFRFTNEHAPLHWVRTATVLAALSSSSLRLETVVPVALRRNIIWGISLLDSGPYTYIYGNRNVNEGSATVNEMFVARVPTGAFRSEWQYFDGTSWVADIGKAVPVSEATSPYSDYTITALGNAYVLTTMGDGFESNQIYLFFSCSPAGPFVDGRLAYITTGHGGPYGTQGVPDVFTYDAYAHPDLSSGDVLVVSYDVNTWSVRYAKGDVNIVRPHFMTTDIDFGQPPQAGGTT